MRYIERKGCEHSVEVYMVVKGCRKRLYTCIDGLQRDGGKTQ